MEKLRLKVGEYELEVEGQQAFIEKHLTAFDERIARLGQSGESSSQAVPRKAMQRAEARSISPAEFYKQKRPDGGTRKLLVLGVYLRDFRGQASFRRSDINTLCEEVRIKQIHRQYYTLAVQQGLLMETENGNGLSVTLTGDEAIERMGSAAEGQAASAVR